MTTTASTHHPLAWHRKSQLMSQRELQRQLTGESDHCGTIFLIENGKTMPTLRTMRRICEILHVDWRDVDEFRASMAQKGVEP